ncbi:DUF2809 domain-containing protein [Fulvivirga lutimaris]|uniref:ribosomal maturation YjgA family protein n=1 Tax=Fulvivirga lutimaris TaxID=1819566 RepID=UPI0012BC2642|nr:DUF2809 domain-containing protein [Fulvivirga lutimaris]MTI39319.1 DUF2809 domain-containing protein [Fulvivirga lutimaris]
MSKPRNRPLYFFLIIGTIACGLASRASFSPDFVKAYAGDPLYALMIFFIIGFFFSKYSSLQVALLCIAVCYTIELSQLYQADWINEIRRTRLGGLVLGFGFLWSDIISYTVGALVGYVLDCLFKAKL